MNFPAILAADATAVQARLNAALADKPDVPVVHAMRYALTGGKGLRGFLVLEGARLHGVADRAISAAAAIEALHAYSLIHDDLPCMDDDDLRRGQPTVHKKWDEATAVLAGDALQTLAFELLCDPALGSAEVRMALVLGLAKASGAEGMVLGQALDMAAEVAETPLTLDQITHLQAGKTGALFRFAAQAGAIIVGADPKPLDDYAQALGLAFQIADDILDVKGDPAKAGKRLGKDAAAGKATFVSMLGLEGAQMRATELLAEAEASLASYGEKSAGLIAAARFVISRES